MPRCKKCGEEYDEAERPASPFESLGELFVDSTGEKPRNLCPACREEMGMFVLLGFDE